MKRRLCLLKVYDLFAVFIKKIDLFISKRCKRHAQVWEGYAQLDHVKSAKIQYQIPELTSVICNILVRE